MKNQRRRDKIKKLPDQLVIPITSEVCIRLMARNDSRGFFEMIENHRSDLRQWLSWVDEVTCVEDVEKRNEQSLINKSEGKSLRFFVVHQKTIIGMMAAKRIDWELNLVELSYSLAPNFRGRGIITQACRELISYFETSFGIRNFEIRTAVGNHASDRIAEKLGFDFIEMQEKAEKLHGDWVDHKIYRKANALQVSEWLKLRTGPTLFRIKVS